MRSSSGVSRYGAGAGVAVLAAPDGAAATTGGATDLAGSLQAETTTNRTRRTEIFNCMGQRRYQKEISPRQ
jgi:hypothetical protein